MSSSVVGPGDIIAERYRLERLLGQGGMGAVYEAVQLSLDRRVALKLLAGEALDAPASAARFEREALALARLNDPHTVRLLDFGTDERRRPFLVMELLKGCDLASDLAHNGPMRWDQALQVSRQVLASLAEAHAAGIVHRDIKPANLFLCAGAEWPFVRVLDFGIAASTDRSADKLTLTGAVVGSAPYMSPEQAQGREAGPAADLYALGVVLFELLTRSTPFAGRTFTAQLLAKVIEPAPALRAVRPDLELPEGVQALVAELLERDAAARPCSARAVAERMRALLAGASLPALVRSIETGPSAAAPLASPGTEPMPIAPTLDNPWSPRKPEPLHEARAPRAGPALLASALLASLGVLGWELWPRPDPGEAVALVPPPAPPALAASPPPAAAVELRAEEVLASASANAPEDEVAPPASEAREQIAPNRERPRPPARAQAPRAQAPRVASNAPKPAAAPSKPPVSTTPPPAPEPASTEQQTAATPAPAAPLPEATSTAPIPPSPDLQLPPAPRAAPPVEPRARPYLGSVESAVAAEQSDEITPAQRDEIIAALRERRQFARSRTIRQYRDGLIDHTQLRRRLREIDLQFGGAPPP
ncbi:MAG TPA: serine/threonine-protein kinase [Polyangiaceae bacterium]|nr:serine/threonine-protein kinase [Polyangiaceae bacterium]